MVESTPFVQEIQYLSSALPTWGMVANPSLRRLPLAWLLEVASGPVCHRAYRMCTEPCLLSRHSWLRFRGVRLHAGLAYWQGHLGWSSPCTIPESKWWKTVGSWPCLRSSAATDGDMLGASGRVRIQVRLERVAWFTVTPLAC